MEGKVHIHSEKSTTVEKLLDEAKVIFKLVKSGKSYNDIESLHRQFCTSYPIVVRYMYEFGDYYDSAFKKLLINIKSKPHQNEDEFLDSQARYVVNLYRCKNKKASAKEIANLRTNTLNILKSEHENFKSDAANAKQVVEEKEKIMSENRAAMLKSLTPSLPDRDIILVDTDPAVSTKKVHYELPQVEVSTNCSFLVD